MTLTIRNITELDDVISTLSIDGYSDSEIKELTKYLNEDPGKISDIDFLVSNKRLEMIQCLSREWIVRKLKRLAEGDDVIAAVNALKVLSEISERR